MSYDITVPDPILDSEEVSVGPTTGDGGEPPLTKAEIRKFKKLCAQVRNDVHLQAILNTVPFDRRRSTYDQFAPHLTFAAKPFEELRFF